MIDAEALQQRLAAAGWYAAEIDGIAAQTTFGALLSYMADRDLGADGLAMGDALLQAYFEHHIDNEMRLAHFLAQITHQSGGFAELSSAGDDAYRQRGFFPLEGQPAYTVFAEATGLPLLAHPEAAEQPPNALRIAAFYWGARALNGFADQDDLLSICRAVTTGSPYGDALLPDLDEREAIYARAKVMLLPINET